MNNETYPEGSPPWMVLFLHPQLGIAWAAEDPGDTFLCEAEEYRSMRGDNDASNQFPAFFDRLLDADGKLLGLQVTPMVDDDLALLVGWLPYVTAVNNNRQFQVFLFPYVGHRVINCGDQAFGGKIYRSESGRFAISYDTYFLEPHERVKIRKAQIQQLILQ